MTKNNNKNPLQNLFKKANSSSNCNSNFLINSKFCAKVPTKLSKITFKITNSARKILTIFSLFGLTLGTISVSTLAQSTPAQPAQKGGLGVMPTNSDPKNSQSKGWFIENVEAGKNISKSATIINTYGEDKEVELRAKDSIQTRDGGWDFRDNSSMDKFLGSWVKLDKEKVKVNANKSSEVKFEINVPSGTKSGEYGAVIAAQLPTVANNQGVAIENRIGSRIYLTVPGELKMSTKMDKFEFLSPKSQDYSQSSSDKVAMQVNFENTGNIFTKSFGKVMITTPKGTIEQVVDRDLAPRQNSFLFNFTTSEDWQVGKYKAEIKLTNRPLIPNKGEISDTSPIETLETEIDLTQDIIDTIKKDRQNPAVVVNQAAKTNAPSTFELGGNAEKLAQNSDTGGDKTDDKMNKQNKISSLEEKSSMMPIIIGGGILGLIIIALLVFILKKRKSETETTSKTSLTEVSNLGNSKPKINDQNIQVETVKTQKMEEKLPEQE